MKQKLKVNLYYYFVMIPIMILLMVFLIFGELSQSIVDKMQETLDKIQGEL